MSDWTLAAVSSDTEIIPYFGKFQGKRRIGGHQYVECGYGGDIASQPGNSGHIEVLGISKAWFAARVVSW